MTILVNKLRILMIGALLLSSIGHAMKRSLEDDRSQGPYKKEKREGQSLLLFWPGAKEGIQITKETAQHSYTLKNILEDTGESVSFTLTFETSREAVLICISCLEIIARNQKIPLENIEELLSDRIKNIDMGLLRAVLILADNLEILKLLGVCIKKYSHEYYDKDLWKNKEYAITPDVARLVSAELRSNKRFNTHLQASDLWFKGIYAPQIIHIKDRTSPVTCFSTDSKTIIVGSLGSDSIEVFKNESEKWRYKDNLKVNAEGVSALAYSPEKELFAVGTTSGSVELWFLDEDKTRSQVAIFNEAYGWINTLAFSSDGNWLAAASVCGYIIIIDLRDNSIFEFRKDYVKALAFSRDNKSLLFQSDNEVGFIFDIENKSDYSFSPTISGFGRKFAALCFSPDGKTIGASVKEGTRLLNFKDGQWILGPLLNDANTIFFKTDNKIISCNLAEKNIKRWNFMDDNVSQAASFFCKEFVMPFKGAREEAFSSAHFSPDGEIFVSITDEKIKFWSPALIEATSEFIEKMTPAQLMLIREISKCMEWSQEILDLSDKSAESEYLLEILNTIPEAFRNILINGSYVILSRDLL